MTYDLALRGEGALGVTDVAQSPAAARPHALGLAVPARLEPGPGAATGRIPLLYSHVITAEA